jgi:hypothetical protein
MKLDLKVTTAETSYVVSTNLFVIVAWERKYKRKASDLASGIGVEDLAFMAFESCKVSCRPLRLSGRNPKTLRARQLFPRASNGACRYGVLASNNPI